MEVFSASYYQEENSKSSYSQRRRRISSMEPSSDENRSAETTLKHTKKGKNSFELRVHIISNDGSLLRNELPEKKLEINS
ncbi:hypothetical protein GCK72_026132 [Caenorhabditis remanei]|uniref:Uncharacterized protein n=1 Tax=Caenorhabditis remanei TaxID=31234 RepID=A0A6A5G508_CAERE|nr:hypothetical protein GCK72_026132 [Caenorhabditis remanei]KAF1749664.1 hypothetical protein GCK72_026132 [Caenorhabditis remanei]